MKKYSVTTKCNARLLSAGRKTIDEIPEDERIDVYVYAVQKYGFPLDNVEERYIDQVNAIINQP